MRVTVVSTEDLGDRTYIADDGRHAVVIDPQRDLDRIEQVLDGLGVGVSLVLETHIHNDYVTGGFALAERSGAAYGVNAADLVSFEREPISGGDVLTVGGLAIDVVATPGHTDTHLSYVVKGPLVDGDAPAVFSGGSLLFGGVGRTDLVDPARVAEFTRAQFQSVRRLAGLVPDDAAVFPTHGFGSFCSVQGPSERTSSTVGIERMSNLALTTPDEQRFVADLVASLTPYPRYYAHMAPLNRLGPPAADLGAIKAATPADIFEDLQRSGWVVDVRSGPDYAAEHLPGTVNIGAGPQLTATLGWLKPWDAPLTLLAESTDALRDAERQLARIGVPVARGSIWGDDLRRAADSVLRSYPVATFEDVRRRPLNDLVLDVRDAAEYSAGHLVGSVNVPTYELIAHMGQLPRRTIWVHCAAGYRSAVAASLIAATGRDVRYVADTFDSAVGLGMTSLTTLPSEPLAAGSGGR